MPYIKKDERLFYDRYIDRILELPKPIGDLNYLIVKICLRFLSFTKKQYSDYNAIIGMLECAKQEFYRRIVAEYENEKIKENGDIV